MKKFYAGIALAGMIAALALTGCPGPNNPVYSISLDTTGTYAFPGASAGYGAQTAKTVTVSNTGDQATGALTITKAGANAASFTVSKTSIADIAVGGSDTFTVVPNTGLAAASYTATITVSGGNGITGSFNVSFTVNASGNPVYSVGLSETGTHTFTAAVTGYAAQTAKSVTVTNTGDHATGSLTIAASGTNAASFTVSKASIADIAAAGTDTFTVVPNTGLAAGTYTATITVSGEHDISESFNVSFTVNPPETPVYSVGLSETETYTFDGANLGYAAQTARTVTVTNTGNQATGALTIAASGTNAASFTVSKTSITDIAVGGSDTFTVVPNTELAVGTYTATITVSGGNSITAGFDVSFTVSTPPDYGIGLDQTGLYTFTAAVTGYAAQAEKTVTVRNTGTNATGALTITKTGTNAASFTVSKTSITDIAIAGTDTFTVVPNTGLAAGTYVATITVSGEHDISESFNVSFTVNPPAAPTTANVTIGIADEVIDLTRSTDNDLSREAGDTLQLTASEGYTDYTWSVDMNPDGYSSISDNIIELYSYGYSYGIHSVLLRYKKDGILYGCEVWFRVVR
jgi:uncharacterized membrane protein